MIETHGLSHISIAVQDLKRSCEFYRALLGMVIMEETANSITLQTPGSQDMLALELRAQPQPMSGVLHFGFRAKTAQDVARAAVDVGAAGGALLKHGEFAPGCPFVYLRDPDGYKIEIWYQPC